MKRVESLVGDPVEDDVAMTDPSESEFSGISGSGMTAGGQTFLKSLSQDIDRLHLLSNSLYLVLGDMPSGLNYPASV